MKASQKVTEESNSQPSYSEQCLTQTIKSQTSNELNRTRTETQNKEISQNSDRSTCLPQINLDLELNMNSNCQSIQKVDENLAQKTTQNTDKELPMISEENINLNGENQYLEYDIFHQAFDYLQPRVLEPSIGSVDFSKHQPMNVEHKNQLKKTKSVSLGGIFLESLNILNDELDSEIQTQSSDNSVKMLSRDQSKCSVVSLKRYKDLDHNSNEVRYDIPKGSDLHMLFKNIPTSNNIKVAMDVTLGDMGFNRNYCDYKNTDCNEDLEAAETYEMILKMYPKENKKIIDVRKKRKIK